ncbi:MAG TPA: hypothetical protein VFX88_16130 [Actinomycetota bacterium]|nr:hypothetical protein [Actinomycetota bacterium]
MAWTRSPPGPVVADPTTPQPGEADSGRGRDVRVFDWLDRHLAVEG